MDHNTDGEKRRVSISMAVQIVAGDGTEPSVLVRPGLLAAATGTTGNVQNQFLQVLVLKRVHLEEPEGLVNPADQKPSY